MTGIHPLELQQLIDRAPEGLDLTDPRQLDLTQEAAERLEAMAGGRAELDGLEASLLREREAVPLLVHVAAKLARSRQAVADLPAGASLAVVFAVYREHHRILPREGHTNGEDFLRRKVAQLRWLFARRPDVPWELVVVDDGCPEGSGELARGIAQEEGLTDRARVLLLADAIAADHPAVRGITSVDDSRKGGSIQLGLWEAAGQAPVSGRVVAFTDADLSTHLGQAGLLMERVAGGASCAAGSRRAAGSVVVKKGTRNARGKLFIYLWKRLLPQLGHVVDSQCGFKAFDARVVRSLLSEPDPLERQFAFDLELMLRAELARTGSVVTVPVAWIDSEAESTTTDLQPYLPMLLAITAMARRYGGVPDGAEGFAELIEGLDEPSWQRLVDAVPPEIAEGDPAISSAMGAVSASDLAAAIR